MSAEGGGYSPCPAEALPELSAAELAMSLSPKSALLQQNLSQLQLQHSTPFSVTDILSPIEEYRKLELANNPPSPYRSNSSGSSINSPLGPASCGMTANPYAVPLYGGAPVQGYGCAPADLPHYGDMRGASWYPASNDPSAKDAKVFTLNQMSFRALENRLGLTHSYDSSDTITKLSNLDKSYLTCRKTLCCNLHISEKKFNDMCEVNQLALCQRG
ncbi:hypothetical protein RR48_13881 [Papilio machaon]|uniref:Uncharacterized protein n=1 Tax=Papilio machaon TaxID=76193 RepID=A0A194RI71_PAPMA|nr:hypothetical protein RR48_13881 [Papilio machaon]